MLNTITKIVLLIPILLLAKPTIKQLFNVNVINVKEINSSIKEINYGYVVPDDSRVVDIDAWFSGYVTKLYVDKLYQKVKKYQLLLKVYSPEVYKAKQDYLYALNFNDKRDAKAMVISSKKNLVLLGVSKKEINDITKKRKVNTYTSIFSPIDGFVFIKNINNGSSFKRGTKLFEIINLDKVWIEAKIYQNQLTKISKLTNFKVDIKGLKEKFKAQKSILYPKIDTKQNTITLRLLLDNPNNILKVGMFAKITSSSKDKRYLVVPKTAVIYKNGMWFVFLATPFQGIYEPLHIHLEPLNKDYYIVKSALRKGDKIVNNAMFMMDSDAQINGVY